MFSHSHKKLRAVMWLILILVFQVSTSMGQASTRNTATPMTSSGNTDIATSSIISPAAKSSTTTSAQTTSTPPPSTSTPANANAPAGSESTTPPTTAPTTTAPTTTAPTTTTPSTASPMTAPSAKETTVTSGTPTITTAAGSQSTAPTMHTTTSSTLTTTSTQTSASTPQKVTTEPQTITTEPHTITTEPQTGTSPNSTAETVVTTGASDENDTSTTASSSPTSTHLPSTSGAPSLSTQTSSTQGTPSTTASTPPPTHDVRISETNLLLLQQEEVDSAFIELKGPPNTDLRGLWLTLRDASSKNNTVIRHIVLSGLLNVNGLFVLDKTNDGSFIKMFNNLDSLVIALYKSEDSAMLLTPNDLVDWVVYGRREHFDPEVTEVYQQDLSSVLIDVPNAFKVPGSVSLSRCSSIEVSNAAFVLSPTSRGRPNSCLLPVSQAFEMKLTGPKAQCDTMSLPESMNSSLVNQIISGVNKKRLCGITKLMVRAMRLDPMCTDQSVTIAVRFTVRSAYSTQLQSIIDAYTSFVKEDGFVNLNKLKYLMSNCTLNCFPRAEPHTSHDDKIKVTVAVVVSCIGVFVIVLIFVVLYMKRKRKGILQFRMTRLDEDDDDLIGDMDDFVGNQGPTFRNYK